MLAASWWRTASFVVGVEPVVKMGGGPGGGGYNSAIDGCRVLGGDALSVAFIVEKFKSRVC